MDLKKIFYKNGTTFTFEKYVTKFRVYSICWRNMVFQIIKHLLDHIMSPDTELKTEVNICRSSHSSTFVKASAYMSAVFAILYPYSNPPSGRFRKRSIYATGCVDCGRGRGGSSLAEAAA